jgi:hypothetical protein
LTARINPLKATDIQPIMFPICSSVPQGCPDRQAARGGPPRARGYRVQRMAMRGPRQKEKARRQCRAFLKYSQPA